MIGLPFSTHVTYVLDKVVEFLKVINRRKVLYSLSIIIYYFCNNLKYTNKLQLKTVRIIGLRQ